MSSNRPKLKGVADIVFLIDVTGSMDPCIDALRRNLNSFIKIMTEGDGSANSTGALVSDWRIKVVGYRDYVDQPSNWLVDHPFSSDINEVETQIRNLEASGGGDEPESLLDALHHVATIGEIENGEETDPARWRGRSQASRLVAIFTDASFHPTMSYPGGTGGTIKDVRNAIHQGKIIVEAFAPSMDCYTCDLASMDKTNIQDYEFDESDIRGAANAMAEFTADRKQFGHLMEMLAKTVSMSAVVEEL